MRVATENSICALMSRKDKLSIHVSPENIITLLETSFLCGNTGLRVLISIVGITSGAGEEEMYVRGVFYHYSKFACRDLRKCSSL